MIAELFLHSLYYFFSSFTSVHHKNKVDNIYPQWELNISNEWMETHDKLQKNFFFGLERNYLGAHVDHVPT